MLLKTVKLNKIYGEKVAVKDVSFEISQTGVYLLAGPNGSGKTTLMEMLVQMSRPSSGQLIYHQSLSGKDFKRKVGILLQQNSVRKHVTVAEEVRFVSRIFKRKLDLESYLRKFDLYEHRHQKCHKLSGGLQRRLLIATTLIPNYELIFFDEPASGLDVQTRDFIWSIIKEQGAKKICLVSDHYLNQAASYCDQLLLMSQGELVFQGAVSKLLSQFKFSTRIQVKSQFANQTKEILLANHQEFEELVSGGFTNYFVKENFNAITKNLIAISENVRRVTVEDVYLALAREQEGKDV